MNILKWMVFVKWRVWWKKLIDGENIIVMFNRLRLIFKYIKDFGKLENRKEDISMKEGKVWIGNLEKEKCIYVYIKLEISNIKVVCYFVYYISKS